VVQTLRATISGRSEKGGRIYSIRRAREGSGPRETTGHINQFGVALSANPLVIK